MRKREKRTKKSEGIVDYPRRATLSFTHAVFLPAYLTSVFLFCSASPSSAVSWKLPSEGEPAPNCCTDDFHPCLLFLHLLYYCSSLSTPCRTIKIIPWTRSSDALRIQLSVLPFRFALQSSRTVEYRFHRIEFLCHLDVKLSPFKLVTPEFSRKREVGIFTQLSIIFSSSLQRCYLSRQESD